METLHYLKGIKLHKRPNIESLLSRFPEHVEILSDYTNSLLFESFETSREFHSIPYDIERSNLSLFAGKDVTKNELLWSPDG